MIGEDRDLLLRLLDLPTAGPLETTDDVRLWDAVHLYSEAAEGFGMRTVHLGPARAADVLRHDVPAVVREAIAADPCFLECQPSLVLRVGQSGPVVMFNVHLDTVAPFEPAGFDGVRFHGRGAIDAKGPSVALLAGVRAAMTDPAVGRDVSVLIQAVSGAEGGAMGVFGTRPLVEAGYHGSLNLFCEPTSLRYLPRSTAAMTASVQVRGEDAVDDHPAPPPQDVPLLDGVVPRWPAHEPAFTCDAIWPADVPGAHTAILGPGSLEDDNAHAPGEHADVADLDRFADVVRDIVVRFARTGGTA
ncbi:M20/M25/M40 family metallo-hydrolase [Saccharothrix stipae]